MGFHVSKRFVSFLKSNYWNKKCLFQSNQFRVMCKFIYRVPSLDEQLLYIIKKKEEKEVAV